MPIHWKNLKEIDTFLESYNLPRVNWEDTDNLNKSIISSKNKAVIKSSIKKSLTPDGFTTEFYNTLKEQALNYSKSLTGMEVCQTFHEASIIFIWKLKTWQDSYRSTPLMNKDVQILSQQNISKSNPKPQEKNHTSWSNGNYPRNTRTDQHLWISECNKKKKTKIKWSSQ